MQNDCMCQFSKYFCQQFLKLRTYIHMYVWLSKGFGSVTFYPADLLNTGPLKDLIFKIKKGNLSTMLLIIIRKT